MKINLANIKKAKKLLILSECVAIPTETVYGLAGNAYSNLACKKIYKLKNRPRNNPLIVHYYDNKDLKKDCYFNNDFLKLYKKFCPGPITFILNLKKEAETFEDLRKQTKQKIQEAHDIKQEYNNKYEIMRFWEKAFSESGLVKYIIKNILSYFNGKTNFYLSHLSKGKFFIEFDEELRETILHNGQQISYISLSGGEKRKIGLAVMLGLQQLLTLSHKSENNLMFFDEVAENLDQDGLDGLYILLSELKKTKNLFVITHNNYLKSLMDNVKTLTITKSKGISSITGR